MAKLAEKMDTARQCTGRRLAEETRKLFGIPGSPWARHGMLLVPETPPLCDSATLRHGYPPVLCFLDPAPDTSLRPDFLVFS